MGQHERRPKESTRDIVASYATRLAIHAATVREARQPLHADVSDALEIFRQFLEPRTNEENGDNREIRLAIDIAAQHLGQTRTTASPRVQSLFEPSAVQLF